MDAVTPKKKLPIPNKNGISREEAEKAVETLIKWAGDDPKREGLKDTPKRVINAYKEFFAGYQASPEDVLKKTFDEVNGYNDIVMLKNISLHSHCEHHMVPIIGKVHLAYLPVKRVVGISKLARVVDIYAKRLQTQETMTQQIGEIIHKTLKPKGVAVYIEAYHQCMTTRGVLKPDVSTVTTCFLGCFKNDVQLENKFINFINN